MKACKILVNNKNYTINFGYNEKTDNLIIEVRDSKNNLVTKRVANIIIDEFFKGFEVEKEHLALRRCTKKDWPIKLYTDTDDKINAALFYHKNEFDDMEELKLNIPRLKISSFLNKGYTFITWLVLLFLIITVCEDKIKESNYNKNLKGYYLSENFVYDENYLLKLIMNNPYLTEESKLFFANQTLMKDIANTNMSPDAKAAISYSLHNFKITEYNPARKIVYDIKELTNQIDNPYGYVDGAAYRKDEINVYECKDQFDTKIVLHEFMHILQQDSKYRYLTESVAEILPYEYFNYPINTYQNSVKRIYILMEIIGPEAVWNAFFGSPEQLEMLVSKYLSEEDAKIFMTCLTERPYNKTYNPETDTSDIDLELDRLLKEMYYNKFGKDINDNVKIKAIYNMNSQGYLEYTVNGITYTVPLYYFNSDKQNEKYFYETKAEPLKYKVK